MQAGEQLGYLVGASSGGAGRLVGEREVGAEDGGEGQRVRDAARLHLAVDGCKAPGHRRVVSPELLRPEGPDYLTVVLALNSLVTHALTSATQDTYTHTKRSTA